MAENQTATPVFGRDDLHDADAILQALSQSRAPVVAVDTREQIVAWNAAAERLMGMATEDAHGRAVAEVLLPEEAKENRIFVPRRPGIPMDPFEVYVRTATGMRRMAMIPIPVAPDASGAEAAWAYVMYPVHETGEGEQPRKSREELGLTMRELEVVQLLAQGKSTDDIAADLSIARTTARNHIQSILQKLNVHSRLEAVAHLRRHGVV